MIGGHASPNAADYNDLKTEWGRCWR